MTHTCTKVTVRQRAIRNDKISLYLDYYPAVRNPETMQMSRREYLGIYIYAHPKNEMEREFNNDMLNKAEAIRCIRVQSLINEEFGFLDKHKMKADFLAYFEKMCRNKDQKWLFVYQHFYNFVKGQCTFGEVNVDLCKRFRDYLLNARQLKHAGHRISLNSAAGYYSTFRGLLKIAYRDKLIRENINDYLEKIEYQDVKREYLTLAEVKQLAATPCDIPVLKAASLFSCLTGLRISDILNLQWEDFGIAPDQGYCLRIRTQKTKTEATLPVSYEAYELCGKPGTGKVFKGLTRSMINYPLKNWLKKARIKKHITFHCFRHSFATLQIAAGTDIYTVSKMMTHRNVSTTQIYAELVNEKKRESANKISLK
ncbi:MAG: site-specific integrase [Bacteroidales bacterium]|nr:site-specific integrase [Bacteroidales bacterium]